MSLFQAARSIEKHKSTHSETHPYTYI